jgi:hypothetical protein
MAFAIFTYFFARWPVKGVLVKLHKNQRISDNWHTYLLCVSSSRHNQQLDIFQIPCINPYPANVDKMVGSYQC